MPNQRKNEILQIAGQVSDSKQHMRQQQQLAEQARRKTVPIMGSVGIKPEEQQLA